MKPSLVLVALVGAGAVLMIATGNTWCYRNDYVSDNITACHTFNGYRFGAIILVDDRATPRCRSIYNADRYPACPGNSRIPTQSCEDEGP